MLKKRNWGFTMVTIITGFMLAVQFQLVQEPEERDTRDLWELKAALTNEQKLHAQLEKDLTKSEEQLAIYESELQGSKEQALKQTLDELKEEAGLTEVSGPGVILTIEPLADELTVGRVPSQISADMLQRLLNELNMFDAEQISINNQRVVNSTVIREINGVTKVDGVSLDAFPIEIKIIVTNAEKMRDRLKASQSMEEFFLEDLSLSISDTLSTVTIPAYRNQISVEYMQTVIQGKGGE
ncbi:MAG: DUF881 domain-containing protein [Bacillus sp. (in: firmicutes)]